jgi:hypothetical protein
VETDPITTASPASVIKHLLHVKPGIPTGGFPPIPTRCSLAVPSVRWNINDELPFNPTGEKIGEAGIWRAYEFERLLDAIQFWNAFNGRWLRGSEYIYPE